MECGVVRRGERASEKEKPPTLVGLWSSVGYQGGAPISPSERPNDVCYTAPQATAVRREGTKRVGRSVGRSSRRQSQCQPLNHERWKRTVCSDLQSRGGSRWRCFGFQEESRGGRCSSLVKAQWEVTRSCHRRVTCGSRSSLFTLHNTCAIIVHRHSRFTDLYVHDSTALHTTIISNGICNGIAARESWWLRAQSHHVLESHSRSSLFRCRPVSNRCTTSLSRLSIQSIDAACVE